MRNTCSSKYRVIFIPRYPVVKRLLYRPTSFDFGRDLDARPLLPRDLGNLAHDPQRTVEPVGELLEAVGHHDPHVRPNESENSLAVFRCVTVTDAGLVMGQTRRTHQPLRIRTLGPFMSRFLLRKYSGLSVLALTVVLAASGSASAARCPVGVNVNSFQNFTAEEQQVIVGQLKRSGVRFVRTSLRPDDKNMALAKNLQSEGIGLVLVPGPVFLPNAPLRPADPQRHIRSAMPLSFADPAGSRTYYQTVS